MHGILFFIQDNPTFEEATNEEDATLALMDLYEGKISPLHNSCIYMTYVFVEKKRKTNVRQSDVNLSPLVLSCSRIPLVQGGCKPKAVPTWVVNP